MVVLPAEQAFALDEIYTTQTHTRLTCDQCPVVMCAYAQPELVLSTVLSNGPLPIGSKHFICALDMHKYDCKYVLPLPSKKSGITAATRERFCAIVITGDAYGCIKSYHSPISKQTSIYFTELFTLSNRLPHSHNPILCIHLHRSKALFVSGSKDNNVKIFNFKDMTSIATLPHPKPVTSAKYSNSGLLLTYCKNVLRVFGSDPAFTPIWSFEADGSIRSATWSPANRIAASYRIVRSNKKRKCNRKTRKTQGTHIVQVWNERFYTLFKHKQKFALFGSHGLVFASNNLLFVSGQLFAVQCRERICVIVFRSPCNVC